MHSHHGLPCVVEADFLWTARKTEQISLLGVMLFSHFYFAQTRGSIHFTYESISLSSSKGYTRGEIGYVTEVNFVRK